MKKNKQVIVEVGCQDLLKSFFDIMFGPTTRQSVRDQVMKNAFKLEEEVGIEFYLNIKFYNYYSLRKSICLLSSPVFILQSSFYSKGRRQEIIDNNISESDWLSLVKETFPNAKVKIGGIGLCYRNLTYLMRL
jgi:hypothetical protein